MFFAGLAIQTVVASYPESFSPIISELPVARNTSFSNLEPALTPDLVKSSIKSILPDTSQASQETSAITPTNRLLEDPITVSAPSIPAPQVKSVKSPCQCTTGNFS